MNLKLILYYLVGSLILISPAFYNGYPLVYSDTGTYIASGMELFIPEDRPIFYGLFIKAFSLSFSLWFVILVQGIVSFYLLSQLTRFAYPSIKKEIALILVALLTWFTGVGWYTSQIMPDIFTFYAIATTILLSFNYYRLPIIKLFDTIILVFSLGVHSSNIFIVLLLLITLFIFRKKIKILQLGIPSLAIVITIIGLCSMNYYSVKSFNINKGGHAFLMGKMLDSGVLKSFLDDNCANENYVLCPCKDSLPRDSRAFLWDWNNSPLYKEGGWVDSKAKFSPILWGIFKSPKHISMYVLNCISSSASQLFQNDIGSGLVTDYYSFEYGSVYPRIQKYFTFESNQFLQSRQNKNLWDQGLSFDVLNIMFNLLLIISTIAILVFVFLQKKVDNIILKHFVYLLLFGVIFNAIVTASLGNVYDRLQSRISWLVVYAFLLILCPYINKLLVFNKREY